MAVVAGAKNFAKFGLMSRLYCCQKTQNAWQVGLNYLVQEKIRNIILSVNLKLRKIQSTINTLFDKNSFYGDRGWPVMSIRSSMKKSINLIKYNDEKFARLVSHVISPHIVGIVITAVYGLENAYGYGRALALYLLEKGYLVKDVNPALSYAQRMIQCK